MQDPFFGAGDVIFQVFSKLCTSASAQKCLCLYAADQDGSFLVTDIVVIFVILICSLGNRPQGSNIFFTGSIVLFAVLQLMLL